MMNQEEINDLVAKYFHGTISPEERVRLSRWYETENSADVDWELNEDENALRARVYEEINARIQPKKAKIFSKAIWYRIVAAAAVLIILAIVLDFYTGPEGNESRYVRAKVTEDILPATESATLTLSDGTTIKLSNTENSILGHKDGVTVRKTEDGKFSYSFSDPRRSASRNAGGKEERFDVIKTPAAGNYKFQLPDGTKVYLNSSSVLKFPVLFSKTNRQVILTGEAYFEVANDPSRPFRVVSGAQTVEVLGTHFNVNSYRNEAVVKTTLIEGRVKILNRNSGDSEYLKPGQEASLAKNGHITIAAADTEQALGWMKGSFVFNDLQLEDILRQFERWYDVRVDYSSIPKTRFNGTIPRNVPLSKALKILEVTGGVRFLIDNRTIKVLK